MKLVILTTDTLHHRHFVRSLAGGAWDVHVLEETEPAARAPFDTAHPFEAERERHEAAVWFDGAPPPLEALAPLERFPSLNAPEAAAALAAQRPDVVVVFGSGRLRGAILSVVPDTFLNLHGGDPEEYRGLDSHLWAIYHGDFPALSTTLHKVAPALDAGDIVATLPIPLAHGMPLFALRQANTEVCVRLTRLALDEFHQSGRITGREQRRLGRYYSFMPKELKEICVQRFHRYTQNLEVI